MTVGEGWSALLSDFKPSRLPSTLAIGVVLALVNALLGVAIMSLIFSGDLVDALPIGIGFGLSAWPCLPSSSPP